MMKSFIYLDSEKNASSYLSESTAKIGLGPNWRGCRIMAYGFSERCTFMTPSTGAVGNVDVAGFHSRGLSVDRDRIPGNYNS